MENKVLNCKEQGNSCLQDAVDTFKIAEKRFPLFREDVKKLNDPELNEIIEWLQPVSLVCSPLTILFRIRTSSLESQKGSIYDIFESKRPLWEPIFKAHYPEMSFEIDK